MPPVASSADRPKKPRNRHSPHQLAALNELYERDEHPALEVRTALADRLGMETKTVNSWFQNKRASTKKRSVPAKSVSSQPSRINSARPSISSSTSSTPRPSEAGDSPEDDYVDGPHPAPSQPSTLPDDAAAWPAYPTADPDVNLPSENESMARRLRLRPTAEQTEALIQAHAENPNMTHEQLQALADSTGLRYQNVTNWFQNQRQSPKNTQLADEEREPSAPPALPPPSKHPSLGLGIGLPPASQHPSLGSSRPRRSASVLSSNADEPSPSKHRSSRRSNTPYSLSMASRLRRARPEPFQLDALKDLFIKNATPTIEQRTALALEIGMDLGKVTNWFRNLRQTSRRRAKKVGDDDDDYGYSYPHRDASAGGASRSTSPSSESSLVDEPMEQDYEHEHEHEHEQDSHEPEHEHEEDSHMAGPHSDAGSDDEYQEAVTPSPPPSPIPVKSKVKVEPRVEEAPRHRLELATLVDYAEGEKAAMKFSSGIKFEDALLLVSFSQQYVH